MPATKVHYYRETDGTMPAREWLQGLRQTNFRAFAKCMIKIRRLAAAGHELRRPEADLLRDGIYELRIREGHVNSRVLYFFFGRNVAILAHAMTKEDAVPRVDIDRAVRRKRAVQANASVHIGEEIISHGEEDSNQEN